MTSAPACWPISRAAATCARRTFPLTRGEGGQNLIGSEQGAALGVIRTQELLAARQIDGAEQFFTRAIDFGFSKTAAETMQKWGHDRILGDIVWVIRNYRPDVIILVFTGGPPDGHGHHQVSAILGKEAFAAAADPARFPEQLRYVKPWQATRIVHALWNFGPPGGRGPQPPPGGERPQSPQLPPAGKVETGAFNPVLGYSYEELAVLSRSMHHSQGTGAMRRPGSSTTEFGLLAGQSGPADLFDGIDTTWSRLPGGAPLAPILAGAIAAFEPEHPEKILPLLVKARPLIAAIDDPLAREKLQDLDEAIAACAGIWIEAQAHEPEAVPGRPLAITTTVVDRTAEPVELAGAHVEGMWDQELPVKLTPLISNRPVAIEFNGEVPLSQPYSQPYWLRQPPSGDVYTVEDQRLLGQADTPPAARVRVRLLVAGTPIELVRPVAYRYASRAEGERTRPLVVVPAVAVNLPQSVAVFPSPAPRVINVIVEARVDKAAGELRLDAPPGWKVEPAARHFEIAARGQASDLAFTVSPPAGEATASLRAVATVGGHEISNGIEIISYPHFPAQTLFPPAEIKLVRADVKVTAHRIGYIMGAGDEMPEALRQLGLEVTLLGPVRSRTGRSRPLRRHRGRRPRLQRARRSPRQPAAPARLRLGRRHLRRPIQYRRPHAGPRPLSDDRAARLALPRHRRGSAGRFSARRQPAAAHPQSDRTARFRRLGAGARPVFRLRLGQALPDRAGLPGPRRDRAGRRRAVDPLRQRRLHFHRVLAGSASCPPASPAPTASSPISSAQSESGWACVPAFHFGFVPVARMLSKYGASVSRWTIAVSTWRKPACWRKRSSSSSVKPEPQIRIHLARLLPSVAVQVEDGGRARPA